MNLLSRKNIYFSLCISLLALLLFGCAQKAGEEIIALQPYDSFDKKLISEIASSLTNEYGLPCITLPSKPIPREAFTQVKTPRYRADKIIQIQKENKPDSVSYTLGLTDKDISTTKRDADGNIKSPVEKYTDWGVFGLGLRPGSSCIVSTFRLKVPDDKFRERVMKVCIHEIGHNLGLEHCENISCVMTDAAESIRTIDGVKPTLCAACRARINQ
ncbi:MAG TPA: matrixin family metalloprotease [Ohtaekwangia sp.]|uniref:matrixin family metalloprotease n=1 Tax=Ohtaekwangia sp. TaxID=2066019 RepID=UPI002F9590A7